MHLIIKTTIILFLFPVFLFAGQHAFVKIDMEFQRTAIDQLKNLQVEINGKKIAYTGSMIKVPLHPSGIDTIRMKFSDSTSRILNTHLKAGEQYEIRFNPCSSYEIMPVKHKDQPETQVRMVLRNRPDSTWVSAGTNEGTYMIPENAFDHADSTLYLKSASIGFCPFSSRHFFVCSGSPPSSRPKEAVEYSDARWKQCEAPALQFLSDERFSIIYDFRTKKYTVTFDGYVSGK